MHRHVEDQIGLAVAEAKDARVDSRADLEGDPLEVRPSSRSRERVRIEPEVEPRTPVGETEGPGGERLARQRTGHQHGGREIRQPPFGEDRPGGRGESPPEGEARRKRKFDGRVTVGRDRDKPGVGQRVPGCATVHPADGSIGGIAPDHIPDRDARRVLPQAVVAKRADEQALFRIPAPGTSEIAGHGRRLGALSASDQERRVEGSPELGLGPPASGQRVHRSGIRRNRNPQHSSVTRDGVGGMIATPRRPSPHPAGIAAGRLAAAASLHRAEQQRRDEEKPRVASSPDHRAPRPVRSRSRQTSSPSRPPHARPSIRAEASERAIWRSQ